MRLDLDRWMWICPLLAVLLAAIVLAGWGVNGWSALLVALLLACPAVLIWATVQLRRSTTFPRGGAPRTRGATMGWAAPFYEWYCPRIGLGLSFRHETLRHAGLKAGERVLDVGCGTGTLTRLAALAVGSHGQAIGIDPAPAMIAVARQHAAREGSATRFEIAAIEMLPFPDASFDVVLCSAMLHHLPPEEKEMGLRSVHRVLKRTGRLIIVDLDRPANPLWWVLLVPMRLMPMTASNLRGEVPAFVLDAGFSSIEARGRWMKLLTFWVAHPNPVNGEAS